MKETGFTLGGELDISSRAALAEEFDEVAARMSDVVVDMTAVTYMDSSAISALVRLHRQIREHRHSLRLRMRRNSAFRLLEIAGLTTVFQIDVAD